MLAPGFIDLGWSQNTAIADPKLKAKLRQGVTTEVVGGGTSSRPNLSDRVRAGERWHTLGDFLDEVDRWGAAINFALFGVIYFSMNEDDVRYALQQPWVSVGSDASSPTDALRREHIHPPPSLRHFPPRPRPLRPRSEAFSRSKRRPQDHLAGGAACKPVRARRTAHGDDPDVVVFDPDTIIDKSTVNGVPVLRSGTMTGRLPGRSIRGAGHRK